MTTAQIQAAREERVANQIAAADRENAQAAANSPIARLVTGEEINPEDFSDEELASLFPAFAMVWSEVVRTLAKREGVSIG
jgi:hypothetical protein